LANLGVLSRRSHVKTAGRFTLIFYNPKSTSLKIVADFLSSEKDIFELNVPIGRFIKDARICPVYT
jgi:hypothetical protein